MNEWKAINCVLFLLQQWLRKYWFQRRHSTMPDTISLFHFTAVLGVSSSFLNNEFYLNYLFLFSLKIILRLAIYVGLLKNLETITLHWMAAAVLCDNTHTHSHSHLRTLVHRRQNDHSAVSALFHTFTKTNARHRRVIFDFQPFRMP